MLSIKEVLLLVKEVELSIKELQLVVKEPRFNKKQIYSHIIVVELLNVDDSILEANEN